MSSPPPLPPHDDTDAPRLTPAVRWLIAINVAIYFLQVTVLGDVQGWLGFSARGLDSAWWWTIVTYMFVHGGFWHLALNMYTLYLFGPRVEHSWSAAEFTRYYILCGLGAWFAHLLFAREGLLVGASGAVMGVMLAYAMRWPGDEVYLLGVIPIRVKWLVGILVAANLVAGVAGLSGGGSGIAYFAHLGGMVAGWAYLRTSSANPFDRFRQRVSQIPDVPDETPRAIPRSLPRSRERAQEVDDIVAKSKAAVARPTAPTRPAVVRPIAAATDEARRTEELNLVLDKISEHGLESLTIDERKLLEDVSKSLRQE